jgi:hypothetical protein
MGSTSDPAGGVADGFPSLGAGTASGEVTPGVGVEGSTDDGEGFGASWVEPGVRRLLTATY